ncbi:MAG: VWA domain-containing protein, partial [Acidobacteriota bacterium]
MKVLALILSAGVPLVAPSLQQEVFRFKVEVRSVYVDVFVTRGGKPVTGLTVEDFEVLDNGVRQKIDLVNVNTVPLSALLVLDTSGSVHGKKLQHLVAAAHAFVDGLEAKDDAGLLTLTQFLSLRKGLDRDLAGLHRALDGPMGIGPTALNDALFAGLKLLEDVSGRPMLLVFTDGVDNASWLSESDLFAVSRASEAVIYAVGVQSRAGLSMVSRCGVGSAHWSVTGKGTRFL